MSIYSRLVRSWFALRHDAPHKGLGHAQADEPSASDGTFAATIWVLVDSQGRFVADAETENLGDEYAFQVGKPDLGEPLQLVKLQVRLPRARAVEVTANGRG